MEKENQDHGGSAQRGLTCTTSLGGFWGCPMNSATPSVMERKEGHSRRSPGQAARPLGPMTCPTPCPIAAGHPDRPAVPPPHTVRPPWMPHAHDRQDPPPQSGASSMEDPKSRRDPIPEAPCGSVQGTPLAPPKWVPGAAPRPRAALGTHCNPSPSPGAAVGAKKSK